MDVKDFIRQGGNPILNPNYKKNNGQPRFINSIYVTDNNNTFEITAKDLSENTYKFNSEKASKLKEYGLSTTRKIDENDLYNNILADTQSNGSKFINAIGQSLVSEILLGTGKGFSDLADSIGQAIGLSDHNYSNPLSQFFEEKQKEFEEWAPIYKDESKNILNGGLTDAGWWFSNLPSIFSTVTLMLPGLAITKGASYLGKLKYLNKIPRFTNKAARIVANPVSRKLTGKGYTSAEMGLFFENAEMGAIMRTAENYQEARQTYNDTYADAYSSLQNMTDEEYDKFLKRNEQYLKDSKIDVNDKDAVAKQIARSSADRTFQLDWANVVFDIYQVGKLRNALSNAPKFMKNASTRRAQREAIRTAGMTEEQKLAELAKDSKLTKLKNWIGDVAVGYSGIVKSELSEGVEEAVNFIAQQEGTRLGKYLLTGENGNEDEINFISNLAPMQRRIIEDYSKDAGLWDSAFWGVLGGVVFQAGGSKLRNISRKIENKNAEKKSNNKNDDTTKEAKVTPHWWALGDASETERMLSEINGRNIKLNTFRQKIQSINDGKNPYYRDKDGKEYEITSDVEARVLREKAYNEYLDDMIVTARNNGTLDMLVAYLENGNVRNAIANAYQTSETNITDEEKSRLKVEADEQARHAVERAKKIDKLYQDEIIHVSDIADRLGDKDGNYVPAEYIQMLASANVRRKLNVDGIDEMKELYRNDIDRIKGVLKDRFNSDIDYESLVSLRTTIQELSSLVAEKKELEEQQRTSPTVSRQFDIDEVNKQINTIKRKALDASTDANFIKSLYALQVANSALREYSPDRSQFTVKADDTAIIENIDEMLQKDLSFVFDELGQNKREVSVDAIIGGLQKLQSDLKYILPVQNNKLTDPDNYLDTLDPRLKDNYDMLSRLEIEKIKENAKLAETESEISHYISSINNIENIARNKAIQEAFDNLKEVQKNHIEDIDILSLINKIYDNDVDFVVDSEGLTKEEQNKVKESIKVLNLANVKNKDLFDTLVNTMIMYRATLSQVQANDAQNTEPINTSIVSNEEEETQNFSASQNPNLGSQTVLPINQSSEETESGIQQGNAQIENISNQNKPKAVTLLHNNNTIIANATNEDSSTNNEIIPVNNLGNDNFELDFTAKGQNTNPKDISSNLLFDIKQQPMDGGVVIFNPIVKISNNGEIEVVQKGIVDIPQNSSTGEQKKNLTQRYIDRLNKVNDVDELNNVYNEAIARGISEEDLSLVYNERVQKIEDSKKPKEPSSLQKDYTSSIKKIALKAREYAKRIKDGETLTYNDFVAEIEDTRQEIGDDTEFDRITKENWNSNMERLAKSYPSAVDNIINILNSDTTEDVSDSNLKYRVSTAFKKEVENLVKAYLKDIGQKKINGKYYISLENLLRYCNGEFKNNENASLIYRVMADYLLSDEAKTLYNIEESKAEIQDENFLDKVKTPLQERMEKAINEENHRINTKFVENKSVFDEIKEGDELEIKKDANKIYFSFNGKSLGYIGIPKVVDGMYQSPYEYFLFNITPLGKDNYSSDIAKLFKSILSNNKNKNEDLQQIYEAAFDNSISLKDNKLWKDIKEKYTVHTIDNETGKEYDDVDERMLRVIRTMAGFSIKYGDSNKAVDVWFNTLAQEYIAADTIAKTKNPKVKIDAITDGFLIRATDRLTDENRRIIWSEVDKLPLSSEAIGSNYKGRVSLGIGSRTEAGTIEASVKKENDKVTIPATIFAPGVGFSNTFVVFPVGNGKTAYAQAYPILAKDLTPDSEASKIVTAFVEELSKYFTNIANNPSNLQLFKELQDFIFEALNYKNATTPLFHTDNCEKINVGDSRGTHIGTNGTRGVRRDLKIFCNPGKTHILQIDKTQIEITPQNINDITREIKLFLKDTLQFNMSANYIASDNNKRNNIEGFAHRDADGKFVVKIGDKVFTFNSYNDFILDNNLVRVNTKPNEHGNNLTRTSSNPNIRYKIVTSSPVEKTTVQTTTQSSNAIKSSEEIKSSAMEIMQSDKANKAEELANLIFDKETVNILVKTDLLPTNLVYDENFNIGEGRETLNASFNTTTKETTIGSRFMSIISNNNINYRKQAIRKLIHERLHDKLHSDGNEHFIKDIEAIYDEFSKYLDNAEFSKPILEKYIKKNKLNISLDDYYENFKKYKYLSKQKDVALEEFLVDSLTSVELANYLNNITGLSKINMRQRKRDTLLNKIMRILAKLMGINIKNDSLYAQEFETLREAIDSNVNITEAVENKKDIIDDTNETITSEEKDKKEPEFKSKNESEPKKELEEEKDKNANIYQNLNNDDDFLNEYGSTTIEEYDEELSSELQEINDKTIANYESVASIGDYIQSYSPEDRAEIAREINNGEINIKCK